MRDTRSWKIPVLLTSLALTVASCASTSSPSSSDTLAFSDSDGANTLDDSKTVYQDVALPDSKFGEAKPNCTGDSNGTLRLGGVLPKTGNISYLEPPVAAGVELAIKEINDNGGVLGNEVEWAEGDSGDGGDLAEETIARHVEQEADVLIGTISSGVALGHLEQVSDACKVMFSPVNTSPELATADVDQIYFRTSPSDTAQGQVLADLIAGDGKKTVSIMALDDSYGQNLLRFTGEPLEGLGVEILNAFTYDPKAESFAADVEKVTDGDPDAIVVIGFEETAEILTGLFDAGIENDQIFLVDANVGNALGEKFEPGRLSGIRATFPTAEVTDDFKDDLLRTDPDLTDFSFGPEGYDTVIITALAATAADSDNPVNIARSINGITRDGIECTSFTDCRQILEQGGDIAYVGRSGPSEFNQPGERTRGSMAIVQYG